MGDNTNEECIDEEDNDPLLNALIKVEIDINASSIQIEKDSEDINNDKINVIDTHEEENLSLDNINTVTKKSATNPNDECNAEKDDTNHTKEQTKFLSNVEFKANDNFIDEINTTIESILIEEKKQNDEILNDSLLANDNVNHKNGDEVIHKDE